MIAYLNGILSVKATDFVIIDVNGVGYKVYMAKTDIDSLSEIDSKIKVFTYLKLREDDISIYGFNSNEELTMFELLISVGGIGAKSAITILSNITPSKFALAIITNDINTLKKLQGIGPKTAQRIVLELKDKIKTEDAIEKSTSNDEIEETNQEDQEELVQALQVLGYKRYQINQIISKITEDTIEEKIKQALQYLSK